MSAANAGPGTARAAADRRPVTDRRGAVLPGTLANDVVSVLAQLAELVGQRFGVGTGLVRPAEADDHVGDPLLFEPPYPVHAVGVHRDHVHLERAVRGTRLSAQPG